MSTFTRSVYAFTNMVPDYRQLGYGTWQAAPGEVGNGVYEALKVGYRHLVSPPCPKFPSRFGQELTRRVPTGSCKDVRSLLQFITRKAPDAVVNGSRCPAVGWWGSS